MRIIIINTFYYPKFVGGAEISVQLLAEGLAKAGNEVFLVTSGVKSDIGRLNGVVILRVKQKNIYSSFHNNRRSGLLKILWHLIDSCNLLNYYFMSRLFKRIKPDIVHTNNMQGFSPAIWKSAKARGIPLVHTFRDYYMLCHRNNLYSKGRKCEKLCFQCSITHAIKKRFADYPDRYIGISHFILDKHREHLDIDSRETEVIYNALPPPEQGFLTKASSNEKLVIGFMGRIAMDKGAGYLAEELGKIRQDLKSRFRIIFAGKGDSAYISHLQKMLNGVEFEFPGVVKPAAFYEQIDVSITPSLWDEPFGRVVIESLAYSVPVIIAESGGLKELHNADCTWSFVPAENKLYPLIEQIINNRHELLQKRKLCAAHAQLFSENTTIRKYMNVYSGLL